METLNLPDDELDEQENQLNKAYRRLNKKVDSFGDDIDSALKEIVRKGRRDLEDQVDNACNRMNSIIESEFGVFTNAQTVTSKLSIEIDKLTTRTLKRTCGDIRNDAERVIKRCVSDFMDEAEEVLRKYLPDVDSRDFIKKLKNNVELEITDRELFTVGDTNGDGEVDFFDVIGSLFGNFINGATFGILGKGIDVLEHGANKRQMLETVGNISSQFDPSPYLESVFSSKERLVEEMSEAFIGELIDPLLKQVSEIKENKANKAKDIKNTTAKLEVLRQQNATLNVQFEEIDNRKREII